MGTLRLKGQLWPWTSRSRTFPIVILVIANLCTVFVKSEVLTPPYFNIAEGRRITASSTCGEGIQDKAEWYCKLVGSTSDTDTPNIINGQVRIDTRITQFQFKINSRTRS